MAPADAMARRLGARGEAYVALQLLLLAVVAAGPRGPVLGAWSETPVVQAVALALVVLGAALLLTGLLRLGRNLTPWPKPRETGVLVEHGVFALVRHPIYGGLILATLGWSVRRNSVVALMATAFLVILLVAKSRREEAWLVAKHPEYAAYRRRTRRFIPFIW